MFDKEKIVPFIERSLLSGWTFQRRLQMLFLQGCGGERKRSPVLLSVYRSASE